MEDEYYINLVSPHSYLYFEEADPEYYNYDHYEIANILWSFSRQSYPPFVDEDYTGKFIKPLNTNLKCIKLVFEYYNTTYDSYGRPKSIIHVQDADEQIWITTAGLNQYLKTCKIPNDPNDDVYDYVFLKIYFYKSQNNFSDSFSIKIPLLGTYDDRGWKSIYKKNIFPYYCISFDVEKNMGEPIIIKNLCCVPAQSNTEQIPTWNDIYKRLVPTSYFQHSPDDLEYIKAYYYDLHPDIDIRYNDDPILFSSSCIFTNLIQGGSSQHDEYMLLNTHLSQIYMDSQYVRYADINTYITGMSAG